MTAANNQIALPENTRIMVLAWDDVDGDYNEHKHCDLFKHYVAHSFIYEQDKGGDWSYGDMSYLCMEGAFCGYEHEEELAVMHGDSYLYGGKVYGGIMIECNLYPDMWIGALKNILYAEKFRKAIKEVTR